MNQKGFANIIIISIIAVVVIVGGYFAIRKIPPFLLPEQPIPPELLTTPDQPPIQHQEKEIGLFEMRTSANTCYPGGKCYTKLLVYTSGKLIEDSAKTEGELVKQLTVEKLDSIISIIRKTGIMQKRCPSIDHEKIAVESGGWYSLNLDGKSKNIEDPALPPCDKDLYEIITFIRSLY